MLDQVSDVDSEPRPESAAQPGDVPGTIRHIAHEDLEAYADGRLASARLNYCSAHLDSCDACRAELEDIRTLKSELSGFSRSEPDRRPLERRKRRPGLTLLQAASVATIFVAAVATFFWWRHESPRANKTSAAVSVAQFPAALPAAGKQTSDTRLANENPAPPGDVRPAPEAHTGFALLGPLGGTTSETRPEFSWQPLAGAIRYSVAIVDVGLHPVQHSPSLRTTVWRPRRPLRRGHTYLWQVTATLRGGLKVVASGPAGMLTESADEHRKVPPG